jgi:hypothetical protein
MEGQRRGGSQSGRDRTVTKREDGAHGAKGEGAHRADERHTERTEITLTEQKRVAQPEDKGERKRLTEPRR